MPRILSPDSSENSRYADAEIRRGAAGRKLDRLEREPRKLVEPLDVADTQSYRIKFGDRIDRIATHFLGDARLWYLLADLNPHIEDFLKLPVGVELRVPRDGALQGLWIR